MKKSLNIHEFAGQVCALVKEQLPSELKEAQVSVVSDDAQVYLQVARPWSKQVLRCHLDEPYQKYLSGNTTAESVAAGIVYNRGLYHFPVDTEGLELGDYKSMKGRIVRRIISSDCYNDAFLQKRPARYLTDLFVTAVWEICLTDLCYEEHVSATVPVTWELLHAWGISVDELDRVAVENTPRLRPPLIKDMGKMIAELGGPSDIDFDPFMVIVSNQELVNGAVAATYPGVRESLMGILQDDVYILPSSIHECIAVAKSRHKLTELYQIVHEINETQVEPEDFLADDVLEYTAGGCLVSAVHNIINENRVFH